MHHEPAVASRNFVPAIAVSGWVALSVPTLFCSMVSENCLQSPFVWPDVAVVHLVCMVPLTASLAQFVTAKLGVLPRRLVGAVCWIIGLTALTCLNHLGALANELAGKHSVFLERELLAFVLVVPAVWTWTESRTARQDIWPRPFCWLVLATALAIAVPVTYVMARCRKDAIHFQELTGQSRLGEALRLGRRLSRLAPGLQLRDESIESTVGQLELSVQQVQTVVDADQGMNSTSADRLIRAQRLAILGHTEAALLVLDNLGPPSPKALNLSGTIHETREEWELGLDDYLQAQRIWECAPTGPERTSGQIRATMGTAYCLRKQGRYGEAEQAYRKLLELSPGAETQFLLAQFYEDTQQTTLAGQHARRAVELAPHRYKKPGQALLQRLMTSHFGCLKFW
ncbi:MAG: hypothetical protein JWM11_7746 [Planctomycetaceae bacterium]|nr:hypothetical protein [Planctomycetaceae bacterium]